VKSMYRERILNLQGYDIGVTCFTLFAEKPYGARSGADRAKRKNYAKSDSTCSCHRHSRLRLLSLLIRWTKSDFY